MAAVQSIERAFAILRTLAGGPAGVTEIAERVDLPKSTVSRLLTSLEAEGAVVQLLAGGQYRIGTALAAIAAAAAPTGDVLTAARPHLVGLTERTGETSGISVIDGPTVYYLDQVASDLEVQVRDWTGERAPLHTVPSGLVLLAEAGDDTIDQFVAAEPEASTPRTVTDPVALRDRLGQIRSAGYVWCREEFVPGINSVAAAVPTDSGPPAYALHVHGPAYRFPDPDQEHDLGLAVIAAAERLGARLAEAGRTG